MEWKPDLSPEQKLDVVLQMLVNISEEHTVRYKEVVVTVNAQGYDKEIFEILLKLLKDGYITSTSDTGHGQYYSNFDGRLFIDKGGYQEQQRLDKIIADQNALTLSQSQTNARLVVFWTSVASVVGALLLLWQVFSWYFPHYSDYPYHWIWETIPKAKK